MQQSAQVLAALGGLCIAAKVGADWFERVDVDNLNIGHRTQCACAQFTGDFHQGNRGAGRFGLTLKQAEEHGMYVPRYDDSPEAKAAQLNRYAELTRAWKALVNELRYQRLMSYTPATPPLCEPLPLAA